MEDNIQGNTVVVNLCFKMQTVTRQDLCNITSLWTLPWMDPISTWGIKTKYYHIAEYIMKACIYTAQKDVQSPLK